MKRRTKEKIGKIAGGVVGIGIGIGITITIISTGGIAGLSGIGITTGLTSIGKLIGGGMVRGIVVSCVGNGVTAATGSHVGGKIAPKIGNKKKK